MLFHKDNLDKVITSLLNVKGKDKPKKLDTLQTEPISLTYQGNSVQFYIDCNDIFNYSFYLWQVDSELYKLIFFKDYDRNTSDLSSTLAELSTLAISKPTIVAPKRRMSAPTLFKDTRKKITIAAKRKTKSSPVMKPKYKKADLDITSSKSIQFSPISKNKEGFNLFESMPNELIYLCFSHTYWPDLFSLMLVCRQFNILINEDVAIGTTSLIIQGISLKPMRKGWLKEKLVLPVNEALENFCQLLAQKPKSKYTPIEDIAFYELFIAYQIERFYDKRRYIQEIPNGLWDAIAVLFQFFAKSKNKKYEAFDENEVATMLSIATETRLHSAELNIQNTLYKPAAIKLKKIMETLAKANEQFSTTYLLLNNIIKLAYPILLEENSTDSDEYAKKDTNCNIC